MKTSMILLAQYETAVIPLERVRDDYFDGMTDRAFKRSLADGRIRLPVTRMAGSQKAARGVHLNDLAEYIDRQREEALRTLR